jgi:hypothetical protein
MIDIFMLRLVRGEVSEKELRSRLTQKLLGRSYEKLNKVLDMPDKALILSNMIQNDGNTTKAIMIREIIRKLYKPK